MTSSLENPNTKPSPLSTRVTSASSPSASDSDAVSSRPPKPAPSTRILITTSHTGPAGPHPGRPPDEPGHHLPRRPILRTRGRRGWGGIARVASGRSTTEGDAEMPEQLGAVVVGTGFGVLTHLRALRAAGFEVTALVGRDPAKTAERAELFGVPHACTSLEEALSHDRTEVVAVATPPH